MRLPFKGIQFEILCSSCNRWFKVSLEAMINGTRAACPTCHKGPEIRAPFQDKLALQALKRLARKGKEAN
jgi:DNA-directed RNA polymerase subunit RPC12/RpoP